MKEVHYYVAEDGKKFNEEKECIDYEFKQKIKDIVGNGFKLFDEKREEITDYTYDSIYEVFAIQVLTIEGAKFLVQWADDYGTESPFNLQDIENQDEDLLGVWAYDVFHKWGWVHLDKFKREVDELYFALQ